MGKPELSNEANLEALGYSDFLSDRYLAGAYQSLAVNSNRIGETRAALSFLDRAQEIAARMNNRNLHGHILWAHGKLKRCNQSLLEAADTFGDVFHYDSTLCFLELCENLAADGNSEVLVHILRERLNWAVEGHLLYAVKIFENALASLQLGRMTDFSGFSCKVQSRRAREVVKQLARINCQ